jgi:hypothetical protein
MPLVLVHNDVVRNPDHQWDDAEGEHYHYPSNYVGMVKPGEPFVYYRGVLRAHGKRGPAQYVGGGRIGRVWEDPNRPKGKRRACYCAIEDHQTFAEPVPAKIDGILLEQIPKNMWRNGVRILDPAVYQRIMRMAVVVPPPTLVTPDPTAVRAAVSDSLIRPPVGAGGGGSVGKGSYRKSKQAKIVGDWAEAVVVRHIEKQIPGCVQCVHRAAQGETPGWDIDYLDSGGVLQRVEVKGTVGNAFTGVEMTAGEMRAAKAHGQGYWLYLVAGCLTDRPKVQAVRDPATQIAEGNWATTPVVFSVKFGS